LSTTLLGPGIAIYLTIEITIQYITILNGIHSLLFLQEVTVTATVLELAENNE